MSCNPSDQAYKYGSLPGERAPLALSYVPMQDAAAPAYEPSEALARGTLFPGLDLPFMNVVNEGYADVPLAELMAIHFVVDELELYLDTHSEDNEAFRLYQSFLELKEEAHRRYVERYGVICQTDLLGKDAYTWLRDPWPWEFPDRRES